MLPVLSAINEDSPTVPALLTDYILNGKYLHVVAMACVVLYASLYKSKSHVDSLIVVYFRIVTGNLLLGDPAPPGVPVAVEKKTDE